MQIELRWPLRIFRSRKKKDPKPEDQKRPPKGEVGSVISTSNILAALGLQVDNPDDIVRKWGYQHFQDDIKKDAHLRAVLGTRKRALLSHEYEVAPFSEQPEDKQIAEFITYCLEHLAGTFEGDISEMMDAIPMGFSVSEQVWDEVPIEDGDWKGKWKMQALKHKKPQHFSFDTDEYGNLKEKGLLIRPDGASRAKPVDQKRFTITTYDKTYECLFGTGTGVTTVWYCWMKKNGAKFFLIFLERWGSPTPKAIIPKDVTDEEDIERVKELIDTWQQQSGIWLPEGFDITLVEAARRGEAGYQHLLRWCDEQISKTILGQTLTTDTGDKGGGSYALGRVHQTVKQDITEADAKDIAQVVNEQIIPRLVRMNFNTRNYPFFRFLLPEGKPPVTTEDVERLAKLGTKIPEPWVHEHFDIPVAEKDEEVLKAPAPVSPPSGPGGAPEAPDEPDEEKKDRAGVDIPPGLLAEGVDARVLRDYLIQMASRDMPEIGTTYAISNMGHRFSQKAVAFTERVGVEMDHLVDLASAEVPEGIRQDIDAYLEEVEQAGVIEAKDLQRATQIPLHFSHLQDTLNRLLFSSSLKGTTDAQLLLKAQGWKPGKEKPAAFASRGKGIISSWKRLPKPEEAVDWLKGLQVVPRDVFDSKGLAGKAFTMAHVESQEALKIAHKRMIQATEQGWTFREFRDSLLTDPAFRDRYQPLDTRASSHLENVFRTNGMSAYNQGRKQMYEDPDVADLIVAYQYNALLDERTRPEHAAMHGLIFSKDSPVWQEWWPPNGYRCRCMVDPIMQNEWDANYRSRGLDQMPSVVKTDRGEYLPVQPDAGFGGPVRRAAVPRGTKVDWMHPKDVLQAEQALKEQMPWLDAVDLGGLEKEQYIAVTRNLVRLSRQYPEEAKWLKLIGITHDSNTYAMVQGARVPEAGMAMRFNPKIFTDARIAKDFKAGWLSTDSMKGVIRHEWSHVRGGVHWYAEGPEQAKNLAEAKKIVKELRALDIHGKKIVRLKHKSTGEYVKSPVTGKIMMSGKRGEFISSRLSKYPVSRNVVKIKHQHGELFAELEAALQEGTLTGDRAILKDMAESLLKRVGFM
jgi:SPP1 gp7 family putative phage head morphogenesis protein